MAWGKVDDHLWGSPKWLATPLRARGLWCSALSYSMDQLTDGFIPTHVVPILGGRSSDANALILTGLWEKDAKGFVFHDWTDYQPSKESIVGKREAEAARKAGWRAKRAGQGAVSADDSGAVLDVSHRDNSVRPASVPPVSQTCPALPDPTRPDPTQKTKSVAAKRGTRIPDDFAVTGDMRAWAAKELPGVNTAWETSKFIDYWRGLSGAKSVKADWNSTWRNWMRRQAEEGTGRPTLAAVSGNARPVVIDQWRNR